MILRYNVGQGQPVDIHHGAADFLQPRLAGHVLIHDDPGVGVHVVDTENRQYIR